MFFPLFSNHHHHHHHHHNRCTTTTTTTESPCISPESISSSCWGRLPLSFPSSRERRRGCGGGGRRSRMLSSFFSFSSSPTLLPTPSFATLTSSFRCISSTATPLLLASSPSSSPSSFSSSRVVSGLPSDPYRNKCTAFFFKELHKGFASPWVLIVFGLVTGGAAFRLVEWWTAPEREKQRLLRPRIRVPMKAEHEAMWGFSSSSPSGGRLDGAEGSPPPEGMFPVASSPGAAIFDPAVAVAEGKLLMSRPRLIHAEVQTTDASSFPSSSILTSTSRLGGGGKDKTDVVPTGEVEEAIIMEVPEYDSTLKDDVFVRSLHYIPMTAPPPTTTSSSFSSSSGGGEGEKLDQYFRFMPGGGKEHIHGMVKCKRVDEVEEDESATSALGIRAGRVGRGEGGTPLSPSSPSSSSSSAPFHCVPYAGDLSRESGRKLLLTLGPLHILQDPTQSFFPFRFSLVKHPPMRALVIGLREGSVPRWISTAYPHFTVDVVEPEVSLIRMAKQYFGFQPHSRLRVVPTTPQAFLIQKASSVETAHTAAERSVTLRSLFIPWKREPVSRKSVSERFRGNNGGGGEEGDATLSPMQDPRPYDLILIDALNHSGNLPRYVARPDFLQRIRQVLSPTGVVGVLLPNRDANRLFQVIQHWRQGFAARSMILVHCRQEPITMLMTFQDEGGRGQPMMGTIGSAEELKDLLRSHLTHYGIDRVPKFDLTQEVESGGKQETTFNFPPHGSSNHNNDCTSTRKGGRSAGTQPSPLPSSSRSSCFASSSSSSPQERNTFFKILEPERSYEPIDYLPAGHPYVMEKEHQWLFSTRKKGGVAGRGGEHFPSSSSSTAVSMNHHHHFSHASQGNGGEEEKGKRKWWKW